MDGMRSGTGGGLMEFLRWTQDKGLLKVATAGARRSAVQKVLEIEGEQWTEIDIRSLDVEDQFERFARRSGSRYSPGSLATYGQRFRDAVSLYLDYLANPTGFRAPTTRTVRGTKPTERSARTSEASPASDEPMLSRASGNGRDLITYPFPLQSGELGYVQLPVRLLEVDADRLCAFIRSLAIAAG